MQKRWIFTPPSPLAVRALVEEIRVSPFFAQVLLNRGYITPDSARAFLHPQLRNLADPFLLPDMSAAVDRLRQAIAHKEKIVIYGDYDVDGLTATAFLLRVLREYTPNVVPFLPNRMDEGYGLSMDGLSRLRRDLAEHSPTLLLAVDCGTGSVAEIAEASARGIDVIVLDHHETGKVFLQH